MKTRTKILIATIVIISTIVLILALNHPKEKEREDLALKEYPLLNITQKVCYRPKACFDTEQKFKEQFPYGYVPEYYPECLVYCYSKQEKEKIINSGLFPIG